MTWAELVRRLEKADEATCWKLLEWEKAHGKRAMFLLRIYGKANKLRSDRERKELLG